MNVVVIQLQLVVTGCGTLRAGLSYFDVTPKKIFNMASVLLKNCTKWDGHKDNDIKHCYRADRTTTLLEPSLKVLFIKFR